MATEFSFEYVFRAPSTRTLIDAYFDEDHLATQDKLAELCDRVIVESTQTDDARKTSWRVASQRQLPMIARPFVSGGRLKFLESCTWKRGDEHVDTSIMPEVLGGRVQIVGGYYLSQIGDGKIRRIFKGSITAAITLLSGKIERGIRDSFAEQCPAMAACTQGWLDKTAK